jgi:hypothetical protein
MVKIYTDMNALRWSANAFAHASLPEQVQLLLLPLTVTELLSQFETEGSGEAFAATHALPCVHNAAATGPAART